MKRQLLIGLGLVTTFSTLAELSDIERITTTGSRFSESALTMSASVSWVDEQTLQRVNPAHIQQALSRIAGVNLQRGNGQEYLPSVRSPVFTGAGACGEIVTAEDDIPLRAAGFCNINELFEAGTEYASAIEVFKGPAGVVYGSNAIHGVINVKTQDPIFGADYVSSDIGSFGYKRAGLSIGNDQLQHGAGILLSYTDDNGYRDDESLNQLKTHIRYQYRFDNLQLTAGLSHSNLNQETASYIIGENSYLDKDVAQQNLNPEAFRFADATRLWIKLANNESDKVNWYITPYLRDQDMTFLMHFLPGQPIEDNSQFSAGVKSAAEWTLNQKHTLTVGLDAEITEGELVQFQPSPTDGSAFLRATIPQGYHYDYTVDASVISLFALWDWQLSSALMLSTGVRTERTDYDYNNRMLSGRTDDSGQNCGFGGCRYSRPESRKDSFSDVSPQVALRYSVSPNSVFYTSLSQGFRAPQATELYRLQRNQTVATLDSVEATNIEAGYRFFGQNLSFELAIYRMDKDNVIFRDSDFFNVSNAETDHQGIEFSMRYQFNPNWQLNVAATVAKHQYSSNQGDLIVNGNDIDTAPRRLLNAQMLWLPSDDITAELNWLYTSKYYTNPENDAAYNGHNLFDLAVVWDASESISLTLKVNNLLDREYAERADYTSFTGSRYFPGQPRHGVVGVEYRF